MGILPAEAVASRSRQERAGRMPTPQRARRPRYVAGGNIPSNFCVSDVPALARTKNATQAILQAFFMA